jgi:hypothetical protein
MYKKTLASGILLVLSALPALALADSNPNAAVQPVVRAIFAHDPVMIAIAECESQFKQFNNDGSVLHGGNRHTMTGIFQIARMHTKEALGHGFDIDTVAGNIAYAKLLYDAEGITPWLPSSDCWMSREDQALSPQATTTAASAGDTGAQLAMLRQQVAQLSAMLRALIAARDAS